MLSQCRLYGVIRHVIKKSIFDSKIIFLIVDRRGARIY
jgi:hypothetical protein